MGISPIITNMETNLKQTLLNEARNHSKATGRALSTIGLDVMNDGKFFERIIKQKGGFTINTFEKFMKYFADHNRNHESPGT